MVRREQEVMSAQERGAIAEDRSRIYWLLSGFFLDAPEPALLEKLRRAPVHDAAADGELGARLAQFRLSLAEATAMDELRSDYARLFLGFHEGCGPPPPYESLHREGRMLGQSTEAVVGHFRRNGVSFAREGIGPEDHIGLELKFLSLLCLRESQAWRAGDADRGRETLESEEAFIAQHLGCWASDYCRQVEAEAQTAFYRNVAGLTTAAIEFDSRQVADMLASLPRSEEQDVTQGGLQ